MARDFENQRELLQAQAKAALKDAEVALFGEGRSADPTLVAPLAAGLLVYFEVGRAADALERIAGALESKLPLGRPRGLPEEPR